LPSFCGGVAATTTGENTACERISNLEVAGGIAVAGGWKTTSRTVGIVAGFTEKPAFYRLTEFSAAERYPESQFNPEAAFAKKNVAWLPVTTPVLTTNFTLTEPHYGTHHVYLQTSLALNGCVSRVRSVSVILEPSKLQTYQLDKKDLLRFLKTADSLGYRFHSEVTFHINTYCVRGALIAVPDPNAPRMGQGVVEDVTAKFEAFVGPPMMAFWELKEIRGFFPGLSNDARVDIAVNPSSTPVVEFTQEGNVTCPDCSKPGTLRRMLTWRRLVHGMYPDPLHHPSCFKIDPTQPGQQPFITKLTLIGPAGQDPVSALGGPSPTMLQGIQHISPGQIIPRGLEEEDGTNGNQTVDEPARPEKP
jgi:hypothetical protein